MLICLSGGADSVALLAAAHAVLPPDASICALHCNFHLRGEESDRDCDFVKSLCLRLGVSLKVKDFDVAAYQDFRKCSVETACRELRYEWFREQAQAVDGNVRIVTAHHSDDNIETLLLNLFRGSGVLGLKGMIPDTGEIMRPLLSFSRTDILQYIEEKGLEYVTDSSNLTSDYRRNFIRNELLPLAETRWPGLRKALVHSQEVMREEAALMGRVVDEAISSPIELSLDVLRRSGAPSVIIYRFIAPHGGNSEQARSIAEAVGRKPFLSGKVWILADGFRVSLERDSLEMLAPGEHDDGCPPVFCWGEVKLSHEERERMMNDRSNLSAWLPRPPEAYLLRRVKKGDRLKPLGMKGSRLLSDIMKDAGMSRAEKEKQWVLADALSDEIIWVPGLRRSRLDLIDPSAEMCYFVSSGVGFA